MMKTVYLQNWVLKIDAERTKKYYDSIAVEEGCLCIYCKNYIKNCETFSKEVLDFYTMLGIDPKKEGEFMEFPADTDKHLYMGFYHLVVEIIKIPGNVKKESIISDLQEIKGVKEVHEE